jgi:hypothetical protein
MVAVLSVCRSNQLSDQAGQGRARAIRAIVVVIEGQNVLVVHAEPLLLI